MFFKNNLIMNYKYLTPFIGILFCWYHFLKNKNVAYINYLPMWNFLIFILLPPGTLLGPITGGSNFKTQGRNYFIRKYIFPIFYKISEIVILTRYKNPIFSTKLLKKYLFNKTIKKSSFNYVFKYINQKKKKRKDIDFLIYFKDHKNKKELMNYKLLKKLLRLNFEILCVGDYLNIPNVKNLGLVSKKKLNFLLSKTKFSICSEENFYSLFALDCINNNVKILTNSTNRKFIFEHSKNFIFIDSKFNNLKNKLK